VATRAAAFARYFTQVVPPPAGLDGQVWQAGVAVAAIATVVAVNVLGARRGGDLQVVGTVLKVGGVFGLIALPMIVGGGSLENLAPFRPDRADGSFWSGMMLALVGVLWAYDGWMNVTPLAEEIRDPERNIPRSLIWGMGLLIALYLAATLAYHAVLPLSEVAASNEAHGGIEKAVAAVYCDRLLGRRGVLAISLLVMASTFISLNGNALTGPRAYFAMARDGIFPAALGRVHPRYGTPAHAIIVQGVWATVLIVVGTALTVVPPPAPGGTVPAWIGAAWSALHSKPLYDILFTYVIFGANIFYLIAIVSVFVLRVRRPDLPRPYRVWGYPWTPALYVVAATVLLGNMLRDEATRVPSIAGLGIIASGVPAYLYFRRAGGGSDRRGASS
jgi:amino acid transporter